MKSGFFVPFRIAAAADLGITLAEHFFPNSTWFPIGGSHLTQLGLAVFAALVYTELADITHVFFRKAGKERSNDAK